jgi:hypothetical protein
MACFVRIMNKSSYEKSKGIHEKELALINCRRCPILEIATFG